MLYILFAIAGLMAIVTAYILNSIPRESPRKTLYRILTVGISLIIFILAAVFLFSQKAFS